MDGGGGTMPAGNPVRSIKTHELLQSVFFSGGWENRELVGWLWCCWVAEQIVFPFLLFFLTRYKGCVCVVRVKGEGCRARVLFSKASSSSAEEASREHGKWIKVWEKVRSVRISVFFSFLSTRLLDSPFIQPIRLRILLSSCQIVLKFQEVLSLLLLQQRQQMTNTFKSVDS